MTLRGHLDRLKGRNVVGWADRGLGICEVSVRSADGAVLATGLASRDRPDLSSLGLDHTTVGFLIELPHFPGGGLIRVFADDVELPNSPMRVGRGYFDGQLGVVDGAADGWVAERCDESGPPLIEIVDQDGRCVGSGQATKLAQDGPADPARFRIELDDSCFGRGELGLAARVRGVVFARHTCELALLGHVDKIALAQVSGWLFAPAAPGRVFVVHAYRDGILAGSARCNIPRGDVRSAHPDSRTPGFVLTLDPPAAPDLHLHEVALRLAGARADLFESPYLLGPMAGWVAAARKAARLALDAGPGLGTAERSVLVSALAGFIAESRRGRQSLGSVNRLADDADGPRLSVIVPVYRGVEVTRACIDSVLAHRDPQRDRVVLINDRSPDAGMTQLLQGYTSRPNLVVLTNKQNLGFIQTVNRGLSFCRSGDVVLLNSDTRVFAGGLDEMWQVARDGTIGTVTALSSNATIFSYPHMELRRESLDDTDWPTLAAVALQSNRGVALDVPTGHGFCMLITRAALSRVGRLDEGFGRGYGEENDFCAKAADLGLRNVAAAGVLVEHTESVSFKEDKAALLAANLATLEKRYPEYSPLIMESIRRDDLRRARWALDAARLRAASQAGTEFVLVVQHLLGGGTTKAIEDIEQGAGYGGAASLALHCRPDGFMELTAAAPSLRAVFAPEEAADLFGVLSAGHVRLVLVHQVIGFSADFIARLADWVRGRQAIFYAHDFYALCPRVTMIDAVGRMCGAAPADVCARCVKLGGAHETSRLTELSPFEHRALFAGLLPAFRHVVTPSADAATYLGRIFPEQALAVVPHPEPGGFPDAVREQDGREVVLFGAIGAHKGSGALLEIARLAQLTRPELHFRVIGHTNIDRALADLDNVTITGAYTQAELEGHCRAASGRLALFLHAWPETYSFTLSEAVRHGFVPLVPDIGAPAERVRAAGFGIVYPFPADAGRVLQAIDEALAMPRSAFGSPARFSPSEDWVGRTRRMYGLAEG